MSYDYREKTAIAAAELTQEQRQKFLDYMWAGKSVGTARELAGIGFEAALGVMNMNIENQCRLRRRSR